MPHVVKIDMLTGHEEIDNLHFILKIIFRCIFIENSAFLNTCTINYEKYCILSKEILLTYLFMKL